jgi:membrane fusion protein (multidrug efflux system)
VLGRGKFALTAAAFAVLAGCSGSEAPKEAATDQAPLVSVAVARATSVDGGVGLVGTVRARRETALSFTTPGRVAQLTVEEGDRVAKGQLLARLDSVAVDSSAVAARADAARANAELKRLRDLFAKGWVPKSRVEAAEAAASAAAARVTATGFDQRFARIFAPSAGVVLRRHVEPSQTVAAGAPIVTLGEATGGFVLRAPIADADLQRVRVGQGAFVAISALGPVPVPATVTEIGGRGDDRTGTFEVELALPNRPGLRSGLIGNARVRTTDGPQAIAIPAGAVWQARADEGFVYVVGGDGRARARIVSLGEVDDREVQVRSGLIAGEQVVTAGIERIREGAKVRVGKRT